MTSKTKYIQLIDMLHYFNRLTYARMLLQKDSSFAIVYVDPHVNPKDEECLFVAFFTFREDLEPSYGDDVPLGAAELDGWKVLEVK